MKSSDSPANRVSDPWTKVSRSAMLAISIKFWFSVAAQGQGSVAPSSFHPFTTPDSTVVPFGQSSAFQSFSAAVSDQENGHGAASAFGDTGPLTNPNSVPVPVTADTGPTAKHLKIGYITFSAGAGLGLEFNDNILTSSTNRKADLILDPNFYLMGIWPLSSLNMLSLRVGAGYEYYVFNPSLAPGFTFQITPGTELSLKAKIGDVSLLLYERPSLQQSPQDDPTAPSGILYEEFDNSVGISALWNLRDATVQTTYDHTNAIPLDSGASQNQASNSFNLQNLRRTLDSLSSSTTFQFRQDFAAGFEGAISSIRYTSGRDNGVAMHAGVFCEKQLTNYTALRISAGYQTLSFGSGASSGVSVPSAQGDNTNSSTPYGSIIIRNRINRYLRSSFSVGREADVSLISNSVTETYIREEATLKVSRGVDLRAHASYEYCEASDASIGDYSQLSFGLSTTYAITRKLSVSLGYEFINRLGSGGRGTLDSSNNQSIGNEAYVQNRVILNFTYAF
jgi:hypothetical protein